MARFIITGSYTNSAMKGMLAKPSDREAAAKALVAGAGGKLEAFYMTTGETDFLIVAESEGVSDVLAAMLVVGASGAVTGLKTVRAFSSAEFTAIQRRAGEIAMKYAPPG